MLTERLLSFVDGSVVIEVKGQYLERFINLCLANQVPLWSIKYQNSHLLATTTIEGFKSLQTVARKCNCRPHIIKKIGLPFIAAKLNRRKSLVVSLIMGLLLLYICSSFVWVVNVEGVNNVDKGSILQAAERLGLAQGAWKRHIPLDSIRLGLQEEFNDIAWVGIRISGIFATVEVIERTVAKDIVEVPGSIVASKDGYLTKLVVIKGTRMAEAPQVVAQGRLLVDGSIYADEILLKVVAAQAIIEAKVWYEGYGQAAINQVLQVRTGRKDSSKVLRWDNNEIVLKGCKNSPYQNYQLTEEASSLTWRNISLPVEVVNRNYFELKDIKRQLSYKEAIAEAEAVAQADVLSKLPSNAYVIQRRVDIIEEDDNTVTIRVTIETLEDIGEFIPRK